MSLFIFIATKTTVDVAVPTSAVNQIEYNRKVANAFRARSSGQLTVGDLKLRFTSASIPNHLMCDGSAVSRTKFNELFRHLGTTAGVGDGSTTFNIPNFVGVALVGTTPAPAQIISDSGTVSTGGTISSPSAANESGHTKGGNVISGGNKKRLP